MFAAVSRAALRDNQAALGGDGVLRCTLPVGDGARRASGILYPAAGTPGGLSAAAVSQSAKADQSDDARLRGRARTGAQPPSVLPLELFRAAHAVRASGRDGATLGGVAHRAHSGFVMPKYGSIRLNTAST